MGYNIRMLHAWVSDPQSLSLHALIADKSYNEIVDFLTSDLDSKADDACIAKIEQEKSTIRSFLSDYQQQLTTHGLFRMHEVMNENEIAIFFRNNHFSAIYKRNGQIWELVTDEGIVDADPRITWQSLSQLQGDEQFVDNKFCAIGQNINQQQQLESYKQNAHKTDDTTTSEEIDIEQKMNDLAIKEVNPVLLQSEDSALAQKLALEDELGVNSADLRQLQREQQQAMQQIEQQKMQQIQHQNHTYPSGQYQQQQSHINQQQRHGNNRGQNNKRKRKKSEDCIVL